MVLEKDWDHFGSPAESKDNVKLGAVKNVKNASSPTLYVSEPKTIP